MSLINGENQTGRRAGWIRVVHKTRPDSEPENETTADNPQDPNEQEESSDDTDLQPASSTVCHWKTKQQKTSLNHGLTAHKADGPVGSQQGHVLVFGQGRTY